MHKRSHEDLAGRPSDRRNELTFWSCAVGRSVSFRGFTIVELLVVIGIIALLVALILPAVMSARASARRVECKNKLRQIGLAIVQEAENKQRFPVAGYWGKKGAEGAYHNWVVQILPWMEQKAIYDEWKFDALLVINQGLAARRLPLLVCPDDQTATGGGDLSYAVNGGIGWTMPDCYVSTQFGCIDLNANGVAAGVDTLQPEPNPPRDRDYFTMMGLMFCDNWPHPKNSPIRHHTFSSVTDGLTHTIMLAESVFAGTDPLAPGAGGASPNWASPEPWRSMFYLSPYVCKGLICGPGMVAYQRANDRTDSQNRVASINYLGVDTEQNLEGQSPWASSFHPGGLHVTFADGRVHFLSETVDGRVYAALLSPQGGAIQGPLAQQLYSDTDY